MGSISNQGVIMLRLFKKLTGKKGANELEQPLVLNQRWVNEEEKLLCQVENRLAFFQKQTAIDKDKITILIACHEAISNKNETTITELIAVATVELAKKNQPNDVLDLMTKTLAFLNIDLAASTTQTNSLKR